MKIRQTAAGVLLLLTFVVANAAGPDWPKLVNGKGHLECEAAFRLAQSAYKSTAFNLWEPQALPKDLNDTLVLGPQALDLSGGDALDANLEVFTKVPLPEYAQRSIYWQTGTTQSNRLVIEEMPRGWRGDTYAVRLVPTTLTTADYFSTTNRKGSGGITTLIDAAWRAPLVFQNRKAKSLWLIDVGQPYVFSPDWLVYLPIAGQLQEACKVQFRPNVKHPTLLLPGPVQRFSALLDRSIGGGENEGTLQPTARIRVNVDQAWANAALRPWAMGTPYNSREEVDAGLSTWAESGPTYRAAHSEMQVRYKIAEKALAAYYEDRFNMSKPESQSTAKNVLDIALRTHYVFPKPR